MADGVCACHWLLAAGVRLFLFLTIWCCVLIIPVNFTVSNLKHGNCSTAALFNIPPPISLANTQLCFTVPPA